MWESDSSTIEQLRKVYLQDLPSQMAAARHESERQALRDKQMKVRNLLVNGYGVPLEPQAVCQVSESATAAIKTPAKDKRNVVLTNRGREKLYMVGPSAETMPEMEELVSQESFLPSKIIQEKKWSRQLSREEDQRAVAKLRGEYNAITTQLAQALEIGERGRLLERQRNIQHLLERGYRVSII